MTLWHVISIGGLIVLLVVLVLVYHHLKREVDDADGLMGTVEVSDDQDPDKLFGVSSRQATDASQEKRDSKRE